MMSSRLLKVTLLGSNLTSRAHLLSGQDSGYPARSNKTTGLLLCGRR